MAVVWRPPLLEETVTDNLITQNHKPRSWLGWVQTRLNGPVFTLHCARPVCVKSVRRWGVAPGTRSLNNKHLYNRAFEMSGTSKSSQRGQPLAAAA